MYFLNSEECESKIIEALKHESSWHPASYDDHIMYCGTVIDDRNEDDGITHRFEWTTRTQLSDVTQCAINETLRSVFNVRGRYEETAGKPCCFVHVYSPRPHRICTEPFMLNYKIEVSYYYDV